MGIILVLLSQALQTDLSPHLLQHAHCSARDIHGNDSLPCDYGYGNSTGRTPRSITPMSFGNAQLLYLFLVAAIFLVFVILFRPVYRRVNAEKKASFEESVYVQSRK